MSKATTGGQALSLVGSLAVDTPWEAVDGEIIQQFIQLPPKERGVRFAELLNGVMRLPGPISPTDELTIEIPALKRPTPEELKKDFPWIRFTERDTSPEGPVKLTLVALLRAGEGSIRGAEYERRLVKIGNNGLGYQHQQWLLKNQDKFPKLAALRGKVYIDFPGLIVVSSLGNRCIPYVNDAGKRWGGDWGWLGSAFRSRNRVAVSGK